MVIEQVLQEVLQLHESGVSVRDAARAFPDQRREIEEMFETIAAIKAGHAHVAPPPELFSHILDNVTVKPEDGYLDGDTHKGRVFGLKTALQELEAMANTWKIALPIGVIVLLILLIGVMRFGGSDSEEVTVQSLEQDEASLDEVSVSLDQYFAEEDAFADVDADLASVAPGAAVSGSIAGNGQDPFEVGSLENESNAVGSDSSLDSFFSEEAALSDADAALAQ